MRNNTRCEASATDGGRVLFAILFPILFNITEFIASIGNSINGPITNTKDMTGRKGNVITAIARETGEFRADVVNDVVNINGTVFLKGSPSSLPVKSETQNMTEKTATGEAITL
ncbi:MAG: hypothetical protein LBG43_04910 [Treponema sp.]|jgi:hypothetical protein|nr:hypothetical protein [Treponema sp.]